MGTDGNYTWENSIRYRLIQSLYCITETNVTLYVNYTSIKKSSTFSDIGHSNFFLDRSPEARETKAKINELHQNRKLLHKKGNNQQN